MDDLPHLEDEDHSVISMILIINCGSEKVDLIARMVSKDHFELQIVRLDEIKNIDFANYNGIIISGAPILLTEIDYSSVLDLFEFIHRINYPILGICFGHQIIGLLYGAKAFRGHECRTDEIIEVIERNELFDGLDAILSLREDHCEGITLPNNFILLAKSRGYGVEAMKHREKSVYGVQFHPEASGESGEKIIKNFLKLCKSNRAQP